MATEEREVSETVRNVLAYLLAHPEAMDTVEGIQQWWTGAGGETPAPVVEQALCRLIERGYAFRRAMADGRLTYGITAKGIAEGRTFLGRGGGLE